MVSPVVEVLQELQVALGLEDHPTPGRALETTLVWYDDFTAAGTALMYTPPPGQHTWRGYTRSLAIDCAPPSGANLGLEVLPLRVEGEARRRLARSWALLRLTTTHGLEQMVRLKAEHAFRFADGWTIGIDIDGRGRS